jgi:hypothetical protein
VHGPGEIPAPPVEIHDWQEAWLVGTAITDAYGREIGSLNAQQRERPPRPEPSTIRQDFRDTARDMWLDARHKPTYVITDRFGVELWHLRQPGTHPLTVHDSDGRVVVEGNRPRFSRHDAISVTHGVVWTQVNGYVRDRKGARLGHVQGLTRQGIMTTYLRYQLLLDEAGRGLTAADAVRLRALLIAIALKERLAPHPSGG